MPPVRNAKKHRVFTHILNQNLTGFTVRFRMVDSRRWSHGMIEGTPRRTRNSSEAPERFSDCTALSIASMYWAANDMPGLSMKRRTRSWLRLTLLLLLVGGVYLVMRNFEQQFVYAPSSFIRKTPRQAKLSFDNIALTTDDGVNIQGWFVPGTRAGRCSRNQFAASDIAFLPRRGWQPQRLSRKNPPPSRHGRGCIRR